MKLNSESGQKIWESHLQSYNKKRAKDRKVCPFPRHTAKDIIQTVLDLKKNNKVLTNKKKNKKKTKKNIDTR